MAHWWSKFQPVARIARSAALLCLLFAPINGGCSCIYTAAEQKRTLARPVEPQRIQAVLRATPGVVDVSEPEPAGTGRLFFVIPIRRDVYHNFRWDDALYGWVKHKEGGRVMQLRAYTWNQPPDAQTHRRAGQLLEQLDQKLLEMDSAGPDEP
jgi:hypothetical protein